MVLEQLAKALGVEERLYYRVDVAVVLRVCKADKRIAAITSWWSRVLEHLFQCRKNWLGLDWTLWSLLRGIRAGLELPLSNHFELDAAEAADYCRNGRFKYCRSKQLL